MQSPSSRTVRPLVLLAAIALAACSDRPNPTQPTPPDANALITCTILGCTGGGTLPPPPPPAVSISSLSFANNTLPIDGTSRGYTATVTNTGPSLSGVVAQGYIAQGSARRAAGGLLVNCGAGGGVLPTGTCQISFSASASNTGSGSGWFVPGIATFELYVTGSSFTTARSVGVNLIPGSFNAAGSTTLSLSGALGELGVAISNSGSQTISGLSYETTVIQGSAHRSAGSMPMACGLAGWGNLPETVNCPMTIYLSVTNSTPGAGTLVAGPATFQVSLYQGSTILSTKSWAMTLVDARITAVTASPNPARIGGGSQPFTMTVSNVGGSVSKTGVTGFIRQGTTVQGSATGTANCGAGTGVLPTGTCTISGTYLANTISSGTALVPGAATLELILEGINPLVYSIDSTGVPITLANLPTIGTVTVAGSAIVGLPGPIVNYTATINNPGPSISGATVKVRILQGAASREANSGPADVDCGSGQGTLIAGNCTFSSIFFATNTGVGVGTLVPGAATLQIQLSDPANGLVYTKLVPITLVTQ